MQFFRCMLFIAAVALGVCFPIFAAEPPRKLSPSIQNRDLILKKFKELGGRIEVDQGQPGAPVVKIIMEEQPASDALLDLLPLFPDLREVSVRGLEIHDAGLVPLKKLVQLQILMLNYTKVSNEGLASLEGIKTLKELDLTGCLRITDKGVPKLKKIQQLKTLDLTFTNVTDQGISELRQTLPRLKILRRHKVSPQDLAQAIEKIEDAPPVPVLENPKTEELFKRMEFFRKHNDWTGMAAVGDRLLQLPSDSIFPRITVAWNLAYNLSCEFDDIADRYATVRQGIEILLEGIVRQPGEGRYHWEVGWYTANKIGVLDDARTFRHLFSEDADLQRLLLLGFPRDEVLGPDGKPDNFLVARQWFLKAQERLARHQSGPPPQPKSPLLFYSSAPMCRFNYAAIIEEEGVFGEPARLAWKAAEKEWNEYGDREIPGFQDQAFRLNDLPRLQEQIAALDKELDKLVPGLRTTLRKERWDELREKYRKAYEKSPEKRTDREMQWAIEAENMLIVTPQDLARRVKGGNREKASRLAKQLGELESQLDHTQGCSDIVNFIYWKQRAAVEQLPSTLRGRQLLYEALQRLRKTTPKTDADLAEIKDLFEKGFISLQQTFKSYPQLLNDDFTKDELREKIGIYQKQVLRSETLPADFPLKEVVKTNEP